METTQLKEDIKVMYVTASSFPDGVLEAHQKIHGTIPFTTNRRFFGLSRPENETIVYRAAAEELKEGEAEQNGFETMIIKKGNYIAEIITDFRKDIPAIGNTFQEMIKHPGIDPEGYCVEWYINQQDVQCMVRLADQ